MTAKRRVLEPGEGTMKLPILDLKAQFKSIRTEVNNAIQKVLEDQAFILGEELKCFEREIADLCGVKHAIGVASGTDALILALKALDIGQGDEVITTPFTFIATGEAIAQAGAKPVFIDIDPKSYCMDPALIEEAVTERTKAVMPVHLYGQCADMGRISAIARSRGLKVVEDCAQAIDASHNGAKAGSYGDAAGFSFFPGKNLGAFGDGGMVTTDSASLAEKTQLLRAHGSAVRYMHSIVGYNSRLDNLQASILRVKLKHLGGWLEARRENARFYTENLSGLPVEPPYVPPGNVHTYHLYTIRAAERPVELMKFLNENGIENRIYYPVPLHLQRCFAYLGYKAGDFPASEKAAKETLSIPVYPELKREELEYVVGKIREFYGK